MRRILLAVPLVLGVAAVVRKLLSSRSSGGATDDLTIRDRGPREDAGAPPSDAPATETVEHEYTCDCGTAYRFTGEGRHRVFWKADSSVNDPVLSGVCAECGKPLPGQHPREQEEQGEQGEDAEAQPAEG